MMMVQPQSLSITKDNGLFISDTRTKQTSLLLPNSLSERRMSVVVMRSSSATFHLTQRSWPAPAERYRSEEDRPMVQEESDDELPGQFDIWTAIQSQKAAAAAVPATYVHPLMRRSSSLLSRESLDMCTENLGSETGSGDFSSFVDGLDHCCPPKFDDEEKAEELKYVREEQATAIVAVGGEVRTVERERRPRGKELTSVNYHCSTGRPRSFPPPLPSISRRNGPCLHMRPHRRDGRLVVEAVPVTSRNYLRAQRVDGRLLLSFVDLGFGDEPGDEPGDESDVADCAAETTPPQTQDDVEQEKDVEGSEAMGITRLKAKEAEESEEHNCYGEEEEESDENNCYDEEEEEEEVEVVDRGTVVEVKVSTQPQQQSGALKVHRSSLVINKFVGGTPLSGMTEGDQNNHNRTVASALAARWPSPTITGARRPSPTTTTAAAAVAAASALGVNIESYNGHGYGGPWTTPLGDHHPTLDNKLLFTSKRRNRGELLHNMRRCSQLRRPLFIWEPCCIATSS